MSQREYLCKYSLCLHQTEQIFQNLRQEYSRIQRRRQLEGAFNQTEACSSSDAPCPSSSLNAPSSPPGRRIYYWPHIEHYWTQGFYSKWQSVVYISDVCATTQTVWEHVGVGFVAEKDEFSTL